MKKPAYLKNILLLAGSVVFFLILCEIFAQASYKNIVFHKPDDLLGKIGIPNKAGYYSLNGQKFYIQINSIGFRDQEHNITKNSGTYRIAIIGDSFVEALMVDYNKTLGVLLQGRLNEKIRTKNIEILNFGLSGSGTAIELMILARYVLKYDPDLVVLAVFPFNDFSENSPVLQNNPYRPYFIYQNSTMTYLPAKRNNIFRLFLSVVRRNINIIDFLFDLLDTRKTAARYENDLPLEFNIYKKEYSPEWEQAVGLTYDLINQFDKTCKKNNIASLILIIPAEWDVYPELWDNIMNKTANQDIFEREKPLKDLELFCMQNRLKCINLLPIFKQNADKELYFKTDGHWNALANEIAADYLFPELYNIIQKDLTENEKLH